MSDELKENKCRALFFCSHSINEPCVHFTGQDIFCAYRNKRYECESAIAQVNKMVLLLQGAGFEVTRKGKVDNE